jgi:hypothetical protein
MKTALNMCHIPNQSPKMLKNGIKATKESHRLLPEERLLFGRFHGILLSRGRIRVVYWDNVLVMTGQCLA